MNLLKLIKRLATDNPYVEHKFVTRVQLEQAKADGYEVIDSVYEDCVIFKDVLTTTNQRMKKEYVLRVPYFHVAKRENTVIKELYDRLNIGDENFEEFNKIREENAELKNEVLRIKNDHKPLQEELRDLMGLTQYLKKTLGSNTYANYLNSYENIKRQREANQEKTDPLTAKRRES